jgi:uncharacterized protein
VAILGASNKSDRVSHLLLQRLKNRGDQVYPVHPTLASIEDIPVVAKLEDLPPCDILTIYVNAERSSEMTAAILADKTPRVIFNPGSENPTLANALRAQGKEVEEACSLVLNSQGLL